MPPTLEQQLEADLTPKVLAGMTVLNERLPMWRQQLDPDRLDMAASHYTDDACGCVAAQVNYFLRTDHEGDFSYGVSYLSSIPYEHLYRRNRWAVDHGMLLLDDDLLLVSTGYDVLARLWRQAIRGELT